MMPVLGKAVDVGDAARFYKDVVWRRVPKQQRFQGLMKAVGQGTANASIGQFNFVVIGRRNELGIDIDAPEVIDQKPEDPVSRFTHKALQKG